MMKRPVARMLLVTFTIYALVLGSTPAPVRACTGIRLTAADGTVVHARTLEFAIDIKSDVIMIPRGFSMTGTTPDGKEGLKWSQQYAAVGANALGLPVIIDGLNEKGLAVGVFYFPGVAKYQDYKPSDAGITLAPWELGAWLLGSFAAVEEVTQNISKVRVANVVFKAWGFVPPVHYVVHDASGKSIVLEYVNGKLNVHLGAPDGTEVRAAL